LPTKALYDATRFRIHDVLAHLFGPPLFGPIPRFGPIFLPFWPAVNFSHFQVNFHAARRVFPGVKVRGCFFHWTHAVQDRMKREGLEDKKTTPEEHRLCRLILSLALLPAEKIDPTFTALYAQTSGRVKLVCDYIDYQWIDDNAFFNPSTWSQYMQHTRTTNSHDHDEGWHNRMKSAADRKSKLNFY